MSTTESSARSLDTMVDLSSLRSPLAVDRTAPPGVVVSLGFVVIEFGCGITVLFGAIKAWTEPFASFGLGEASRFGGVGNSLSDDSEQTNKVIC